MFVILLNATIACPLLAGDQSSLEFTTTTVYMNIFCTSLWVVIVECQRKYNFRSVQQQFTIRTAQFLQAFASSDNYLCSLFESVAVNKLSSRPILISFSVKSITSQLRAELTIVPFVPWHGAPHHRGTFVSVYTHSFQPPLIAGQF